MNRRSDILTGAFVLAGLAVIVLGALWLSETRFGTEDRVLTAHFERVGQIKTGNTVTIRGVQVGRVERIDLAPEGVRVELRLRADVELPPNPVVVLQPANLFGDWQATISPGSVRPDVAADTLGLPEGHLPGVTLSDFAAVAENTEEIASNLRGITDRIEMAFNENTAADLGRAIQNFGRASDELVGLLERQRLEFGEFAGDLADAGEALRRSVAQADSLLARLASATAEGQIEDIFENTRSASASVRDATERLRGTAEALDGSLARADSAIAEIRGLLASVSRGEGSLGLLASDVVLYENTAAALAEFRALLDDLQANPRKYFNLSIF